MELLKTLIEEFGIEMDHLVKTKKDYIDALSRFLLENFRQGGNAVLILDEAQNLTSKQMKTLVTRSGSGTKIICLGNLKQIDTPYLTETTSGLTFAVDRFKDWAHAGHITLRRGERSRLADYASDTL